jgi:23S rRNA (cytosine1962-C5)-methyltransferase
VAEGHGWVTRDRDTGDTSRVVKGSVLELVDGEGRFCARALMDPGARIIARVLTRDRREVCDDGLYARRALEALELRRNLNLSSSMYRLIHAEADGLPGLTVDLYGLDLVAQLYTDAAGHMADVVLDALMKTGDFRGAYLKTLPRDRRQADTENPGHWVAGELGPAERVEVENGVKYYIRPYEGLSTGIFLDHRDTRMRLPQWVRQGQKVLNAFSYTGAFSVVAALQGAQVDTIDLSARILDRAKANFALNGLNPAEHRFVAIDTFEWLAIPQQYDLIILDPPTFSSSRTSVWNPGRLIELNALAMAALKPGGLLLTSSNYAGLKEDDYLGQLHAAAQESKRSLRILSELQAGLDFPFLNGFPETRHLKGVLATVR